MTSVSYLENSVMAIVTDIGTLLTQSPGVCGGRLRIASTGVSVRRIAIWYKLGNSAEEVASRIPHLALAQIHAALARYHANQIQMDAEIEAERVEAERLEREHTAANKA
jgi:uncharacterized protein (DUF433 family)